MGIAQHAYAMDGTTRATPNKRPTRKAVLNMTLSLQKKCLNAEELDINKPDSAGSPIVETG